MEMNKHPRDSNAKSLPDFIIIGAMRAGTSWLFHLLGKHPHIHLCAMKEPQYFVSDESQQADGAGKLQGHLYGTWHRGLAWYKSQFRKELGLRVEASTMYTKYPRHLGVVDRMFHTVPSAKLLYVIRNPVDRAISHYLHNVVRGTEQRPIWEALQPRTTSPYVFCGMYHLQLSIYLTRFRRDQFYMVIAEKLWESQSSVLDGIYGFLAVPPLEIVSPPAKLDNRIDDKLRTLFSRPSETLTIGQATLKEAFEGLPKGTCSSRQIAESLGWSREFSDRFNASFSHERVHLERYLGHRIVEWDT